MIGDAVASAWIANGAVRIHAEGPTRDCAAHAADRMRFALGVDHDLRPFLRRFRWDPLIGPIVRRRPWIRPLRRPEPFEALAWAITEQLIEYQRAVVIQRRMIAVLGRRCRVTGLRDAPSARVIADEAPARLASFDMPQHRASTLRRAAIEVARGRVDLSAGDHEAGWRRLRAIPGIGDWTLEMLALAGQGRDDCVPAGDLGYIKLVGRITTGRPKARADIPEVRGFFERYGEHKGLAGEYLRCAASHGWLPT
jgi:3-methyladenine DNA glycosylase/8-oxoguanine DNA glycosylase